MPEKIVRRTIVEVGTDFVKLNDTVQIGKDFTDRLRHDSIAVTDKNIGLRVGAEIEKSSSHPGFAIVKYGKDVSLLGGHAPALAQNPYNFVEVPAGEPWLDDPKEGKAHPGHDEWDKSLRSGRIRFSLEALTPVFVPEGTLERKGPNTPRSQTPTPFLRLHRANGDEHFAIHGASLKGVLRAGVEAVANDRFGIFDKEAMGRKIPYRRRVYADADTQPRAKYASAGVLETEEQGKWIVREAAIYYLHEKANDWSGIDVVKGGFTYSGRQTGNRRMAFSGSDKTAKDVRPFRGNLLWSDKADHRDFTHIIVDSSEDDDVFTLPADVVAKYKVLVTKDPHYKHHYDNATATNRNKKFFKYRDGLPPFENVRSELATLKHGDLIYFTFHDEREIDSFGKNINYLWPAEHNIKDGVPQHFRDPESELLGLKDPLGLAERMFGFTAPLKGQSHPFRGKLRFETLWGPLVQGQPLENIELAPLTSPAGARAKSRPLYLEGKDGKSASYSDPNPRPMGRKFYWHQRNDGGARNGNNLWPVHQHQPGKHAATQLPDPIAALPAGTVFEGCIHFSNLSDAELGALLLVLTGFPQTAPAAYDHCLKIGKGKPRGMGSMRTKVESIDFCNPTYYDQLETDAEPYTPAGEALHSHAISAFMKWIGQRPRSHLKDFTRIHSWPTQPSIRVYPINFKDYGWLPEDNVNPDKPRGGPRPLSLPRARNVLPECP